MYNEMLEQGAVSAICNKAGQESPACFGDSTSAQLTIQEGGGDIPNPNALKQANILNLVQHIWCI